MSRETRMDLSFKTPGAIIVGDRIFMPGFREAFCVVKKNQPNKRTLKFKTLRLGRQPFLFHVITNRHIDRNKKPRVICFDKNSSIAVIDNSLHSSNCNEICCREIPLNIYEKISVEKSSTEIHFEDYPILLGRTKIINLPHSKQD